ncbi:MAG: hypothetical protein HY584_00200 [Candidatus Omnitrophica bacterium]|nr:hypothetical protein [Candidatus Omnitrophota bacterium]
MKGFTVLDLVITVAILALLLSVSLPNFLRMRQNAEDQKAEKELQNIYTAIVIFEAMNGRKPTSWAEMKDYIDIPNAEDFYELNA